MYDRMRADPYAAGAAAAAVAATMPGDPYAAVSAYGGQAAASANPYGSYGSAAYSAAAGGYGGGYGSGAVPGISRPSPYGAPGGGGMPGCKIIVEGLKPGTYWQPVKDFFKQYGYVTRADVSPDGIGSVSFDAHEGARNALAATGQMVAESVIRVRLDV